MYAMSQIEKKNIKIKNIVFMLLNQLCITSKIPRFTNRCAYILLKL